MYCVNNDDWSAKYETYTYLQRPTLVNEYSYLCEIYLKQNIVSDRWLDVTTVMQLLTGK